MDHEGFFLARRRWRHAVMAVAVCSIAGLGTTTAAAQPATPEDLAADVIAAARDGNLERFLTCLEPTSRRRLLAAMEESQALHQAMAAFDRMLDRRFGGRGVLLDMDRENPTTALRRLAGAEILETTKTPAGAEIRLRMAADDGEGSAVRREEILVAVSGRQGWGLVLGFPPSMAPPARAAALALVTGDADAGAFVSRLDAMIAADRAMRGERP